LRELAVFDSVDQLLAEPRVVTKIRVRREDVPRLLAGEDPEVPR
jgi:hypothetical protein